MGTFQNNFTSGRMEKDLDERLVPENAYRNALNVTVDTSEGSNVGSAQNSLGNSKINDLATITGQPITNCRTIGAVRYERDNLIYWLVAGDKFDAILEYNEVSNSVIRVLQSNKATPTTPSKLNFNHNFIVTGINFIDGKLFWTDNYNPPRTINISRAKSYSIDDVRILNDIDVILVPPLNSPKIEMFNDTDIQTNNLEEKFLYFSYRYKYIDGQYSAMSPFSSVAFIPGFAGLDYDTGTNNSMKNSFNSVNVYFETGGLNVTEIQLLVRDVRNSNISIVESFNKNFLNYTDNDVEFFRFNNSKIYTILTSDQAGRLFDNVPLLAKSQDFVGERLMYGNYTQFRNISDCNNTPINIKLKVGYLSTSTEVDTAISTFRSDRDYEIGIVYTDKYARATTVLTSKENTVYIPSTVSDKGNSLKVTVSNAPPCWATNWKLVIKQSKKGYYNLFPITFYENGLFRYFMISQTDLDKIKVGEYIIFKSTASGPTYSNKKYKILEIKQQSANFITGSSQLAGLYFKIKVDSVSELGSGAVFSHSSVGIGGGVVDRQFVNKTPADILNSHGLEYREYPIHYGSGNKAALTLGGSNEGSFADDARVIIKIITATTYQVVFTKNGVGTSLSFPTIMDQPETAIVYNSLITTPNGYSFMFNSGYSMIPNDYWVINCRKKQVKGFGGLSSAYAYSYTGSNQICAAIIPADGWSSSNPETDVQIEKGAIITIQISADVYNPSINTNLQTFPPSPAKYENLEEWWYESGAHNIFVFTGYNGSNLGASNVFFRRGKDWLLSGGSDTDFDSNTIETGDIINAETLKYPIRMIIISDSPRNDRNSDESKAQYPLTSYNQPKIVVGFTINQQVIKNNCETEAKDNELDIYHELSDTYRVAGGMHVVAWRYSDFTVSPSGYTNLGQLSPGSAPGPNDFTHNFLVGDMIRVNSDNNANFPSGGPNNVLYKVTAVPDSYNVVIALPFPGSGPVTGGSISYNTVDTNQTNYSTAPAVVQINNTTTSNSDFNAWAFGDGLESDRILDDYNYATHKYSIRASAVSEDYKQKVSENAICYSGIYGINTGVNRLNEFNLSIANFKYLAKEFGSIQKLHARDTDLLVFQYDKISSVLYGKNLLSDAIGGGQVVSIPEVLGTQLPFRTENGISANPESFATWGADVFCTDSRRGTVIRIVGNQIEEINNGMSDYFKDLMRLNPNTQKLGAYDPYQGHYVLASNERSSIACSLELSRTSLTVRRTAPLTPILLFTIITNGSWSVALVNNGFGTNWVTGYATAGFGTQDIRGIVAYNGTGANRTIGCTVTYCFGLTKTFTLTQSKDNRIGVVVMIKK